MGRLEHGFAAFGLILKTGWRVNDIVFNQLLRASVMRRGWTRPQTYCFGECLSLAAHPM
jgi:hypothetical protein